MSERPIAEAVRGLPRRGEHVRCNVEEPHRSHLQALPCRNGVVGELYPIVCPGVEAEHSDGGGAGSQDPSDEAQQRPLRGSMPSPATEHFDGDAS